MQEVSRVREGRVPCLLAGDFNAEPYTDPHRLLTKGNFSLIRIRIQVQKSMLIRNTACQIPVLRPSKRSWQGFRIWILIRYDP